MLHGECGSRNDLARSYSRFSRRAGRNPTTRTWCPICGCCPRPVLRFVGPDLPCDNAGRLTPLALCRRESPWLKELPNLNVKDLRDALDRGQSNALAPACFDVLKVANGQSCFLSRGLLGPATRKPSASDVGAKGGGCWHANILASCTLWKHAT